MILIVRRNGKLLIILSENTDIDIIQRYLIRLSDTDIERNWYPTDPIQLLIRLSDIEEERNWYHTEMAIDYWQVYQTLI